ncbi:hypothetical protein AHAS_Ahas20G0205800 [Arachis hypogaea]
MHNLEWGGKKYYLAYWRGNKHKFLEAQLGARTWELEHHATQVISPLDTCCNLMDFLTVSGSWDLTKLSEWLPDSVIKRISAMVPPSPWKGMDSIA